MGWGKHRAGKKRRERLQAHLAAQRPAVRSIRPGVFVSQETWAQLRQVRVQLERAEIPSQAQAVPALAVPIAGPSSAPQAPAAAVPSSIPSAATSSAPPPLNDDDCQIVFARPENPYVQGVTVRFERILRRYYLAVGACRALAVTQRQALLAAQSQGTEPVQAPASVADTLSAFVRSEANAVAKELNKPSL